MDALIGGLLGVGIALLFVAGVALFALGRGMSR